MLKLPIFEYKSRFWASLKTLKTVLLELFYLIMTILPSNSNHKPMPDPNISGVSVSFQLSKNEIVAFFVPFFMLGAGFPFPNNQIQNVNQSQNCTVEKPITTSVSLNMPLTPKD